MKQNQITQGREKHLLSVQKRLRTKNRDWYQNTRYFIHNYEEPSQVWFSYTTVSVHPFPGKCSSCCYL